MLRELTIENFALIDSLQLSVGSGFCVLTGETGAGKSIIIDALNAVLGQRVGAEAIRGGAQVARIEAVFDASDAPLALDALQDGGLRDGEDTTLILSREIASGRSHYRVNHRTATLSLLQEIGRHLVDIHGQHEHQTLIHEENHLSFLDAFGGPEHAALIGEYADEFRAFGQAQKGLQETQMDERERVQRLDMLRFQVEEISGAELRAGEEEELATERSRLQHAERIREAVAEACDALDGDVEGSVAALAAVETSERDLSALVQYDPDLAQCAEDLRTASVLIGESVRTLRDHFSSLEADPERLENIEQRLADISSLKRKYGDSVADIIEFGERAQGELEQLENVETREQELRQELERRRVSAGKLAERLSKARAELAGDLKKAVEHELQGLGMEKPVLEVALEREDDPNGLVCGDKKHRRATARGIDICRFLFSANPGEQVRPLSKIASGGELSRLMLVFKSACSRGAQIPTIIFDEVDAGIGGRVAHAVGERIVSVALGGQVLCVTHLPQIARLADAQVRIAKGVKDGRTVVSAQPLSPEERVDEIARMLGGGESDKTARAHAGELLREGEMDRERIRSAVAQTRNLEAGS